MAASASTDALVALEDRSPDWMFERLPGTGIRIWPLLRLPLAQSAAEVELQVYAVPRRTRRGATLLRRIRNALPNPHDAARAPSAEIAYLVSGTTVSPTPSGRRNWLVEDHAEVLGDRVAVLQEAPYDLLTPRTERPTLRRTWTLNRISTASRVNALGITLTAAQQDAAARMVELAFEGIGFDVPPERRARVLDTLRVKLTRTLAADAPYRALLDRIAPRAVAIQGAAYGDRSHLIAGLRERGIQVWEPQHGIIMPSHAAYNHGAAMRDPRLAPALPEVLLTFGEFWSESMRFAGETIAVGKPSLEASAAAARPRAERDPRVLVISSVYDRDNLTDLTLELRRLLPPDWTVAFRPHPSERLALTELYPRLVGAAGVTVDLEPDANASLARSRAVFGLASTMLFEALAFDCQVFVQDNGLADLYAPEAVLGTRLRTTDDVAAAVDATLAGRGPAAAAGARLWQPDARAAFAAFVRSRLGG